MYYLELRRRTEIVGDYGDVSDDVFWAFEQPLSASLSVNVMLISRRAKGLRWRRRKKGKGAYSSWWNSPQNYGTLLVNGITQCCLPPDRDDRPAFTPTGQVGTQFIDLVRMKSWVDLVAGYVPRWFTRPQTVIHPGTNRVWRSATTLIEANALPLSQTANNVIVVDIWW